MVYEEQDAELAGPNEGRRSNGPDNPAYNREFAISIPATATISFSANILGSPGWLCTRRTRRNIAMQARTLGAPAQP